MADLAAGVFAGMDLVAGRGPCADQLERLRHRGRRRWRWPTPPGCWMPRTWRRRSASRASPPTSRCCTRPSSAPGPTPCSRAHWRASASCSTAATCGARARRGTFRTRSTSAARRRSRRPRAAPLSTPRRVLAIELNAAQGNPLVSVEEGTIRSACLYEVVGVSAALDFVRIALATMLLAASERSVKLMDTPWSGLPVGLRSPAARTSASASSPSPPSRSGPR